MDLEQYKKAWKNQEEQEQKITAKDILSMTQSKSSSIIKWIFIIGIIEFTFWLGLNYLFTLNGVFEPYRKLGLIGIMNATNYLHYAIVILFLIVFYKNYSSISVIDDTKTLMKKILRTRRTVKWYVYYNLASVVIASIIINVLIFSTPNAVETIYHINSSNGISPQKVITIAIIAQVIVLLLMILFLGLFYYLLYGILLKKLNRNYKELTKLESS